MAGHFMKSVVIFFVCLAVGRIVCQIDQPPSPTTAKIGDTITLMCEVSNPDEPTQWWEYISSPVGKKIFSSSSGIIGDPNKYEVEGTYNLIIKNLEFTDGGLYGCITDSMQGPARADLVVIDKPQAITGELVEGETTLVSCNTRYQSPVHDEMDPLHIPKAEGYIIADNIITDFVTIKAPEYYTIKIDMNYTGMRSDNGRNLTCRVFTEEPFYEDYGVLPMDVKYEVGEIDLIPKNPYYYVGEYINCTASGNPYPDFEWRAIYSPGPRPVSGQTLTIETNMIGLNEWKCRATNTVKEIVDVEMAIEFAVREDDTDGGGTAVRNSTGKSFAVVFPAAMNDVTTGRCIAYISAMQDSNINVTDAITGSSNYLITGQTTLTLDFAPIVYRLVDGVENKVIYIESTEDVTVALSNIRTDDLMDMTLALPKYEGTNDYHIISHKTEDTSDCDAGTTLSFYNVAAYEDNTVVTIYEPQQGNYVQINRFTLNRFQVYTDRGTTTDKEITGLYVVSDKSVSVTAGNSCADLHTPGYVGNGPIWASMQTDYEVGNLYYSSLIYYYSEQPHRLGVLAIRDNTSVTFRYDGSTTFLNTGEFVVHNVPASIATEVIQCSNSCVVAQYGINNDIPDASSATFMTVLPSTEQFVYETQFTFSHHYDTYFDNHLHLILLTNDMEGANLKVDGNTRADCFTIDEYSWCVFGLDGTEISHTVTADAPFYVLAYGYCRGCDSGGYGYIGAFTSMGGEPEKPPEPDRNSTEKKPQYEITMIGMFYSSDGSDFTPNCGMDYSISMNNKAVSMIPVVNELIDTQLCTDYTTDDMDLISASSLFQTSANTGDTKLWFILRVSSDTVTPSIVESCASEIDNFLVDHDNWGDPLLPTLPGCPGVVFTSRMFNDSGNVWICVNEASERKDDIQEDIYITPRYVLAHSGSFSTSDDSDISLDCLSGYVDNFQLATFNQMQQVNGLISTGELCVNAEVSIETASINIYSQGKAGQTFQEYAFTTGDITPEQLYSCIDEVSIYLQPHTNWPDPVIDPPVGCPHLLFSPQQFIEQAQGWICL